jgi:hypothetical protein
VPAVVNPAIVPTLPITITPHVWTPDATGLYHTTTNLLAEWQGYYQQMQMPSYKLGSLTAEQRAEGNAWEVFQATSLHTYPVAQQEVFAEDFQREADAITVAMQETPGVDPAQRLTETSYLAVEKTLQNDPVLLELAVQGHGLNDPPASRYYGYTEDFQNNTDNSTLFVGGGLDNNETAVPNLFDDVVMTHMPFATVWYGGTPWQLNQNGDAEDPLDQAVIGMDDIWYGRVLTSADFSTQPSSANNGYVSPFTNLVQSTAINVNQAPSGGEITTLFGPAATTITQTAHVWIADPSTGLYQTTTTAAALATEWQNNYQQMLNGNSGSMTPLARLEGNAEAVFEHTGLKNLSAAQQAVDREDAQREFDAIAAAMQINQKTLGIDPTKPFTETTYLEMEQTLQNDPTLEELAIQGQGLNTPPAPRYSGYTNDFQNHVDYTTVFLGGGLNNGRNALAKFFGDNVMSHAAFPVVWWNGQLVQLNQNGYPENYLADAVNALNNTMFYQVYTPANFSVRFPGGPLLPGGS